MFSNLNRGVRFAWVGDGRYQVTLKARGRLLTRRRIGEKLGHEKVHLRHVNVRKR